MIVRLRLFAVARERAGAEAIDVDLSESATVGALRTAVAAQYPQLAALVPHMMFAVNSAYAHDDAEIEPDAEVACIPPVSGG
jgi:sulfur-carrier protein